MMCTFRQLYFSENGYVVCCNNCSCYQLGYGNMVLTLHPNDFKILQSIVKQRSSEIYEPLTENVRQVVLPTPYSGVNMLLTVKELQQLHQILEATDNEVTALAMLQLFDNV